MRAWAVASGLALMSLGAVGCGPSAPPDPTVIAFGDWGKEVAAVECGHLFGCCDAAELTNLRRHWTTEAECLQMVADIVQTGLIDNVRQGIGAYDGKAARRCIDETAVDCMHLPVWGIDSLIGPSCMYVERGTFPEGAACEDLDFICASGNCQGTCAPPRPCWNVVCDAGQYCDTALNACAPTKADGATCGSSIECGPPSVCVAGVCGPPLPEGAACTVGEECASAACGQADPTSPFLCRPRICDGI